MYQLSFCVLFFVLFICRPLHFFGKSSPFIPIFVLYSFQFYPFPCGLFCLINYLYVICILYLKRMFLFFKVPEVYGNLKIPADGVLVHGIFLDAGQWDRKRRFLIDPLPGKII